MKLKRVHIENYRSIKALDLELITVAETACTILLGINESGKSNILKAISLLDKNTNFNYDKDGEKESRKTSQPVKINFLFELEKTEIDDINAELSKAGIKEDAVIIKSAIKETIFSSDSKRKESWHLEVNADNFPFDSFLINDKDLVLIKDDEQSQIGAEVTLGILNDFITRKSEVVLEKLIPRAIYWKYSPNYIISQPIDLNSFSANINTNVPLRNIFALAGMSRENIQTNVVRAKREHDDRAQLEKDLSRAATEHINDVWPEHKIDITVRVDMSGMCTVHVSDKDSTSRTFSMEDRSDGFKQFVSILLTLSAENKNQELKDVIILVDEPENSLHPSSVQYLRDELLKIARSNTVLAASHSIFLVDKKNVDRHVKVFKEKGETKIERIKSDNPFAEEVIYRAFGTSIYEIIEPYLLIFEGSTDSDIYKAFMHKLPDLNFPNVGVIPASGVSEIRKYVKFCNQKTVTGIAVVDSDSDGRNELKHIKQSTPDFANNIIEISELIGAGDKELTLEDLLPQEVILDTFKELYGVVLPNVEEPVAKKIKEFKRQNNINKDHHMEEFKALMTKKVITDMDLEKEEVEQKYKRYIKFLKALNRKITTVSTSKRTPSS